LGTQFTLKDMRNPLLLHAGQARQPVPFCSANTAKVQVIQREEQHPPPVEWQALQALVDRKLPKEEVWELYRLTLQFRSWAEALAELDTESLRKDLRDPEGLGADERRDLKGATPNRQGYLRAT
jgi:hypothetical protein